MGRKRKNAVYAFFSFSKENNSSTCQVLGCSAVVKGDHGTNLMYHLSSNHPTEYKIVTERNRLMKDVTNKENNITDAAASTSTGGVTAPSTNKINYLKNQCVNLVTVHGRPFSMIDDLAFRNIISMISINSREAQSLNSHSIKQFVSQIAEKKRADIAADIRGRMISIKVDSATRLDRSFFAVNTQYIVDGSIHIKHLGVVELHARSTAEYLKEKLLYILRKFKINIEQIYSITTDNGANMVKIVRLLNDELNDSDSDEEFNQDMEMEPIQISLRSDSDDTEHAYCITSVRCAAHTLQLAVNDAINEDESKCIVEEARAIVRKLRTPTMKNILQIAKKNKPILDITTRWHSTLDMLERLIELREYCSSNPGEILFVAPTTWDALHDLINALKPAKVLTKLLQEEQLTLGDFYYHWSRCYLETSHVQVPLAQLICSHMKIRQMQLMHNSTFVGALYLDPRFQVVLSAEEELLAIRHLNETWLQILKVEADIMQTESDNQDTFQAVPVVVDEMESILSQTEQLKRCSQREHYIQTRANIRAILENFSAHPRLPSKQNIIQFWKSKELSEPQLYRLANTVIATPATQVTVERFFSSLKFILNDLRYNLSNNIVEDILIIRNNS
ncbi:hypothetical protein evm_012859 [Chilo suppressalis]|nr:hypothetical protein evm_012859 [Chilo suppressalis]